MAALGHCMNCSALDGCYFIDRNMPILPIHSNCDCHKQNINYSKVKNNAVDGCYILKVK